MTVQHEQLGALQTENLYPAQYAGEDYEARHDPTSVLWTAFEVQLPDDKSLFIRPLPYLREGPFHSYLEKIDENQTATPPQQTDVAELNDVYSHLINSRFSPENDFRSRDFRSLRDSLGPRFSTVFLVTAYEAYKNEREAQRARVAKALNHIISQNEVFVVCLEKPQVRECDSSPVYAAQLAKILSVRRGDEMRYERIIKGKDGTLGTVPAHLDPRFGLLAPEES